MSMWPSELLPDSNCYVEKVYFWSFFYPKEKHAPLKSIPLILQKIPQKRREGGGLQEFFQHVCKTLLHFH